MKSNQVWIYFTSILPIYSSFFCGKGNDICGDMHITWIGTGMGGIIGMFMSSMRNTPINKLIVNDCGPFIYGKNIASDAKYIEVNPVMRNLMEIEQKIREKYKCGKLSDCDWQMMSVFLSKKYICDGIESENTFDLNGFQLAFDEKILQYFVRNKLKDGTYDDINLYPVWKMIDEEKVDILVVKGELSCVLTDEIVEKMKKIQPRAIFCIVSGVGHAPMLNTDHEIEAICKFLH